VYKTSRPRVIHDPPMAATIAIARLLHRPIDWASDVADQMSGAEIDAVEAAADRGEVLAIIDLVLAARTRSARRIADPADRQRAVCTARLESSALFCEADIPQPKCEPDVCLAPAERPLPVYPTPPTGISDE
jgi:hypothetical protein